MNLKVNAFLLLLRVVSIFTLRFEGYEKNSDFVSCGMPNIKKSLISIEQLVVKEELPFINNQCIKDQYNKESEQCIINTDLKIKQNEIKSRDNADSKMIKLLEKFPEFKDVKTQKLLMLSPSKQCKCHQKTVFFKYPSFIEADYDNLNITELKIENKEYFIGIVQLWGNNINSTATYKTLKYTLKNNNIIRLHSKLYNNLYWRNREKRRRIPKPFEKYQKFNGMLMGYTLSRKDMLYENYERMKKKFPDEFDYMPETYTTKKLKKFKKKYKNYQISKDNLWLVKPSYSQGGSGIHFLKNMESLIKKGLVTKYIANPLLINNRKFDIRLYLLVTGHDPLKIYIYNEGLVRLSTENYDLDLNDLDNLYKHLTNTSVNKKNKKKMKT